MKVTKIYSLRLIDIKTNTNRVAKTYRDAVNDEYQVRLLIDGIEQEGARYFTNDKQDALDTASMMISGDSERLC